VIGSTKIGMKPFGAPPRAPSDREIYRGKAAHGQPINSDTGCHFLHFERLEESYSEDVRRLLEDEGGFFNGLRKVRSTEAKAARVVTV
jgi:hypothetical protein